MRGGMRVIPTTVHGMLDYLVGVLLAAGPWIFQFQDAAAAKWTAVGVGVGVLATWVMADYELGLMRVIPMRMHLMADVVVGAFLAASPWIVGFAGEGANAWVPLLVIGLGVFGAAMMSQTMPRREGVTRHERRATL